MISYIIKRDGRREQFDLDKIANAVFRAAQSVGGTDAAMARDVAEKTCALYEQLHGSQEPTAGCFLHFFILFADRTCFLSAWCKF